MGRKIIVLSDGTGHSARKLFRTNVWRIYQALDLSGASQIALYDDGVGTSKFKLLALLGGGFGWGLKRNVISLYTFLCQNYHEGDDIYAFGFSRGAFTVRVLMKFVLSKGLVSDFYSQDDLHRKARYLYRRFREQRRTRLRIDIVGRWIRNGVLAAWGMLNHTSVSKIPRTRPVRHIKFIGVWDTVDAYCLPVREFKLGIEYYLWPLALEDRVLDPAVEKACHALCIDDKRHTFHPLLWDESDTTQYPITDNTDKERLTQTWFAGVHTNVGGGYPDDSLSHVSLCWMIGEAQKKGLLFDPAAIAQIKAVRSPYGRMYDSRAGLGAYYRYDPRRLDPPIDNQGGSIPFPKIHASVFERMAYGSDSYAPLSLPRQFRVVTQDPSNKEGANIVSFEEYSELFKAQAELTNSKLTLSSPSDDALTLIWDSVWWRRIVYFTTLAISLYLLVLPYSPVMEFDLWDFFRLPVEFLTGVLFQPASQLSHLFLYPLRVMTRAAEGVLPGFVTPWIDAINSKPGLYLPWLALLLGCLRLGSLIDRRIQDRALAAWNPKWRHMRHIWSRQVARPRVIAAIAAASVLSAYVSLFFLVSERVKDGEQCHFHPECLLRGATGALSKDPWGIYILFRMYFAFLLLATALLVLWTYYQTAIRPKFSRRSEIRGFLLWLAHFIRQRQRLIQLHQFLTGSVVPLVFAAVVVATVASILNQMSFLVMDSAGLLCRPPPTTFFVDKEYSLTDSVVIRQPLKDFCGLVDQALAPNTTYQVVANYFDEPTNRERHIGLFSWETLTDVPVPLRAISESVLSKPFRRRIDLPRHVMIAKDQPINGNETVLDHQSTEVLTGRQGLLYLYVNEPVIGLPFLYDWFYRDLKGSVEITLTPKAPSPPPPVTPQAN